MQRDQVGEFYRNEHQREAVKAFFNEAIDKKTLELAYSGEDTKPIKQAKEFISDVFHRMGAKYHEKKKKEEKGFDTNE